MQTVSYKGQKVLILAPHADDETIGCGGVIQKYVDGGSPVRVVIATFVTTNYRKFRKEAGNYEVYSGEERMSELEAAFRILGITDYHFMYLDKSNHIRFHSQLDALPRLQLVNAIEAQIQEFEPTIIYIPSKTKHQDHEVLHAAAVTATRPYFWQGSVVVYETDGELAFDPNFFVPLCEEEVSKKMQALSAYRTQVGTDRHPVNPQFLCAKARFRGQPIYAEYAEAFQIIRMHG